MAKKPRTVTQAPRVKSTASQPQTTTNQHPELCRLELLLVRPMTPHLIHADFDQIKVLNYLKDTSTVCLKTHLTAVFDDGAIDAFSLADASNSEVRITLVSSRLESPGLSARFPDLSWAGNSRFSFDIALSVPSVINLAHPLLNLTASVNGQSRTVARILVTSQSVAL